MKKMTLFLFLLTIFLTSCERSISISYEAVEEWKVYAIEEESKKIQEVYVDYAIEDAVDLFELYTIYQNYLPMGYLSPLSPNISLLDIKIEDMNVTYIVDNYVLISDIDCFKELIIPTAKLYGYSNVHIIFNENKLF